MYFQRRSKNSGATISTASLPDIVFMLLFFFMIATVMVENVPEVQTKIPKIANIDELKNRSLIEYLYVGPMIDKPDGEVHIQYRDKLIRADQVGAIIDSAINTRPDAEQGLVTVSLTINETTKMKLVDQIKRELQDVNRLKILYKTEPMPVGN